MENGMEGGKENECVAKRSMTTQNGSKGENQWFWDFYLVRWRSGKHSSLLMSTTSAITNTTQWSSVPHTKRYTFYIQFGPMEREEREERAKNRMQSLKLDFAPCSGLLLSLCLSLVFPTIVVHQVNEASQKLIRSINPFQRFSSLSARHASLPDSILGGKGLATFGDIPDARWCSYLMLVNMFLLIYSVSQSCSY